MKYFAIAPALYAQIRASLDILWGHPIASSGRVITESCLPSLESEDIIMSTDGRVLVPVTEEMYLVDEVKASIDQLLSAGQLEELSEAEFTTLRPTAE